MKPGIIVLIVVGSIATITGSILLGLGISKGLSNAEILTHEMVLNDEVNNFDIHVETSDVIIKVSDSDVSKVICKETEKVYHTVSIVEGTLNISSVDNTKWYERMFPYHYADLKVEVYLAKKEFNDFKFKGATGNFTIESGFTFDNLEAKLSTGNTSISGDINNLLKVESSTGDTVINKVNVKNLELKASTGKTTIKEVGVEEKITAKASTGNIIIESTHAADLDAKTSTGNIKMNGLVLANEMKAESDTGNVVFDDTDCLTADIITDTGNVKGTFLTNKIIFAESDTGSISVPHLSEGGVVNIKSDTGNIVINIKG